jgi:3-(3-hydroxy-phenyl)propionate hydroxylase
MLITAPNIAKPDDFYTALLAAHEGLSEAQSHQLNAALALLLANHVGDAAVLQAALDVARASVLSGIST